MIKVIAILTKIIIVFIISILFSSCKYDVNFGNGVNGNGTITTETRNIKQTFSGIDVSSGISVVLEQSDASFVSVEADSNLQKLIETKVENGILIIAPSENIDPSKTIEVVVKTSKIENLNASSGSEIRGIGTFKGENITVDTSSASEILVDLKYDNIVLEASSGSNINVKGIALKLDSSASSGSEIEALDLQVNEVIADVSSGASIQTHPLVKLNANASSGGDISYNSNPKSVSKDESSGGNVGKE
jgi:Putative auto-transporter adhesin, head GIN domain